MSFDFITGMVQSPLFLYHLFFGLLVAMGLGLLVSVLFPRSANARGGRLDQGQQQEVVTDLPAAAQMLAGPLTDLGLLIFGRQDPSPLEDRLRRSGWRYKSAGDYYASQMAQMVLLFGLGLLLGLALSMVMKLSPIVIALLAAGFGLLGLYFPENNVRVNIDARRAALYREMAWTVDRIAIVLSTGKAAEEALEIVADRYLWLAGGRGGLFMALLRDIALSIRRSDFEAYLDQERAALPDNLPELDEFIGAVKANLSVNRQSITEQLRALGQTMRTQLNLRIDELAQKASLQVALVTSAVVVPMMLIVVGGVALIQAVKAFGY